MTFKIHYSYKGAFIDFIHSLIHIIFFSERILNNIYDGQENIIDLPH